MAGALLAGCGFPAVIKTRPLAGRGVDGQGAPAMLRLATSGAYTQETGALQNVYHFGAPNWFG